MIAFIEAAEAAARLDAARDFVLASAPGDEVLIVGASRDAADDFVRDVAVGRGATFGLHRFSLLQLAARVAAVDLAACGISPASALGAEAVTTRAAFQALRAQALDYLEPVAHFPGFARALTSTLAELSHARLDPGELVGAGASGRDLAELLRRFDEERTAAAVADTVETLMVATGRLRAASTATPSKVLLLDVPIRTNVERAFVQALCARAETLATVPAGDRDTRRSLDAIGGTRMGTADAKDARTPPALARLRRFLFSSEEGQEPDSLDVEAGQDEVRFFSAPGEARECVEIARRVLQEARLGIPFDRIAILLRAPRVYSGLVETALQRAGVPAHYARGTRRPDPAGRAFLALLACAAERLSARRFAEYLSLAQVPDLAPDGAPPAAPAPWVPPADPSLGAVERTAPARRTGPRQASLPFDSVREEPEPAPRDPVAGPTQDPPALAGALRAPWKWEDLIVEAAVIGGLDRWRRRLAGLAAELALRLQTERAKEPDSPRAARLERDLGNLEHLRRFAVPLLERLDALPGAAAWGGWLEALRRLAPMALRDPVRVLAVLAELQPLGVVGPVGLDEIREVLGARLSLLEDEPPARRFGRVFVGTPDQARGRTFDVVFLPGLAERAFPQKTREDPLLLDRVRARVGEAVLDRADERVARERLLLRLGVGAATHRVHLSYPRMGLELGESRPRVPSFYALDVVHATTGAIPRVDQFERTAAGEANARLAWPAPPDPSEAIDDFEHDLAVLGPMLHGDPDATRKGRARYLLDLNPHLRRSLRSRWGRWEERRWSQYDGLVTAAPRTREALARHRLHARPYSVSSLQHYAACPYRFLLAGIYRFEPREEPVALEQLDPLTRGSIFHQVQAETLRALEAAGALPIAPARLADHQATLDRTLDRVAEERRDELAPAIQRVWQDGIESMRADLRVWLRLMAESSAAWVPIRFELGFGMPPDLGRDSRSVPEPVTIGGRYLLHGVVDLVERSPASGHLRITDYKTGGNYTKDGLLVGGGEILQPVLYSLAVEAALGATVQEARLFYCTTKGHFSQRLVPADDSARAHALVVLSVIDKAVASGALVPAPREGACRFCDFVYVCGPHEEERVRRKDHGWLQELDGLRKLP
jgi:CRISPR/Cas system-associated exonuclease Cas4 (RecB family)